MSTFKLSPSSVVLLFLVWLGSYSAPLGAYTRAEWQEIMALKRDPARIFLALQAGDTLPAVKEYFEAVLNSPDRIRRILPDGKEPIQFRYFLLNVIIRCAKGSMDYPNRQARPQDYIISMLAAFRDSSEDPRFREYAYHAFAREVFPYLRDDQPQTVLSSLYQRAGAGALPEEREFAIPALLLIEGADRAATRLEQLRNEPSPRVKQRALEALTTYARIFDKKLDPKIQMLAAEFLEDKDHWVRVMASRVLADPKEGPLAQGNRLYGETLGRLGALSEQSKNVHTLQLVAYILGKNLEKTFFVAEAETENLGLYADLVRLLAHEQLSVRSAAVDAFVRIKPADEATQLALVECGFKDENPNVARAAFEALGVRHKHRGDHRIRSEAVKSRILALMLEKLNTGKPLSSTDKVRLEDAAEALNRNPPRSLKVFGEMWEVLERLAEAIQQWEAAAAAKPVTPGPPQPRRPAADLASERRTRDKLKSSLQEAKSLKGDASADQYTVLSSFLARVGASDDPEAREIVERGIAELKPSNETILLTLFFGRPEASPKANVRSRRVMANYVAGLSKASLTRLVREPGADLVLADALVDEDREVRRAILGALVRQDVSLSGHRRLLFQNIVDNMTEPDPGHGDPSTRIPALAITILERVEATRGRHQWLPTNDLDFNPEFVSGLVEIARMSPEPSDVEGARAVQVAQRLIAKIQAQRGYVGSRCERAFTDIAAMNAD